MTFSALFSASVLARIGSPRLLGPLSKIRSSNPPTYGTDFFHVEGFNDSNGYPISIILFIRYCFFIAVLALP